MENHPVATFADGQVDIKSITIEEMIEMKASQHREVAPAPGVFY